MSVFHLHRGKKKTHYPFLKIEILPHQFYDPSYATWRGPRCTLIVRKYKLDNKLWFYETKI
jgi:hypothetical protein